MRNEELEFHSISTKPIKKLTKIGDIIKTIYQNLSITGSESYYDLPLMEFMLDCLMHLLACKQWSLHFENGQSFCIELFNWLAQVCTVFADLTEVVQILKYLNI